MSGEEKSRAEQQLDAVEKHIKSYQKGIGITERLVNNDLHKYLNLSKEVLQSMDQEECFEAAVLLQQEAFFIQREINFFQNRIDWANSRINKIVTSQLTQYDKYLPYEAKRLMAINGDSSACEYQKIVDEASRYKETLNYLPSFIRNISQSLFAYGEKKKNENSRFN